MNRKYVVYPLGIAVSSMIFICTLICAIRTCRAAPPDIETSKTTSEFRPAVYVFEQVSAAATQPLYLVRLVDGQVRVENAGDENDYHILTCIDPRLMRQTDRQMLMQGIKLYSQAELLSFLEDFCS